MRECFIFINTIMMFGSLNKSIERCADVYYKPYLVINFILIRAYSIHYYKFYRKFLRYKSYAHLLYS